jgi:hypothetical protein
MNLTDYLFLSSSICAFIIAVLAVAVTFKPPVTMKAKIIWIAIFIVIGFAGIICQFYQLIITNRNNNINAIKQANLQNQQGQKEDEANQNIAYLKGQIDALIIQSSKPKSNKETELLTQAFNTFTRSISKPPANQELSLKKRSLNLANDILKFSHRKFDFEESPDFQKQSQDYDKYANETMRLYKESFELQVFKIHDEFKNKGLINKQLDNFYQYPTNPLGIEEVAKGIITLSDELPY